MRRTNPTPMKIKLATAARTAAVDMLEGRLLLSAAMQDPQTGLVTINGTDNGETIDVEIYTDPGGSALLNQVRVRVAGVSQVFTGNPLPERIFVNAGAGDDVVHVFASGGGLGFFGAPVVEAFGGDGNDRITCEIGQGDSIYGGAGNDSLMGGNFDDMLDGGAGDDELAGFAGNDTLLGGDGADQLYGARETTASMAGAAMISCAASRRTTRSSATPGTTSSTATAATTPPATSTPTTTATIASQSAMEPTTVT